MKLRKEYSDVIASAQHRFNGTMTLAGINVLMDVVERCQALADSQPRKQLSDEEIRLAFDRAYGMRERRHPPTQLWLGAVRAVVDAAFEKQKEQPPEPLDFEKLKTGEWEVLCCGRPTAVICAATFAASPEHYTMRRKA